MQPMAFLIETFDAADAGDLRVRTRPAHLAFLAENTHLLLLAGAQWSDDGQAAIGSVLVVDVETRAEAEAFAAADPYARAGLFDRTRISPFRVAFLDRTSRLP